MNVISRGIRNAFRNGIRTFSIVIILGLSMGLGLSMLIANQAVTKKINDTEQSANNVGNTIVVNPAGARGFEGGGTALTDETLATIKKSSAHVTSVEAGLSDRLTTVNTNLQSSVEAGDLGQRNANSSGQNIQMAPSQGRSNNSASSGSDVMRTFTPPVTVQGTTTPNKVSSNGPGGGTSGTLTIKSGKVFEGTGEENVAMVGSSLATKNNLKVGSTFTAYNQTIKVVAIFDAGNTFSNNQLIMPLKTMQKISSQEGKYTSINVNVDKVSNVDSVTSTLTKALGSAADVTNDAERAKQNVENTVTSLSSIQTISLYSVIGAVGAGAVIILLTMVMIVRERRREIGVIKAIGASNIKVVTQFATEAMTLTVLASFVGILLGVLASGPITSLLVNNVASSTQTGPMVGGPGRGGFGAARALQNIQATVGWEIILYGLGIALVIAIIGSVLASFTIAKVRPAEVMRAE